MYRVTTQWTGLPGMPAYTNLHFEGGGDPAEAAALADLVEALWAALDAQVSSRAASYVLPDVAEVDPATGAVLATFPATTAIDQKAGAGDAQPFAVQGLVRLRTGTYLQGREIRGRVFMPGTCDTFDLAGVPNPAYTNALQNAFNTMRTDAAALGVPLVVWSPTRGVTAAVSSISAWNQWAVMRSRRP